MLDLLYAEINKIQDPELRQYTYAIASSAPVDSWKLPSSRDHHLRDECGAWGNLIHTVRVARVCAMMSRVLDMDQPESDTLRSAAVLHDICKHGVNAEAVFIYKEHPQLFKKLVEKLGLDLNPEVNGCIEEHMGRWGPVSAGWNLGDQINIRFLLHLADCIESQLPDLKVPKPGA